MRHQQDSARTTWSTKPLQLELSTDRQPKRPGDLRVAGALGSHLTNGLKFLCREEHFVRKMVTKVREFYLVCVSQRHDKIETLGACALSGTRATKGTEPEDF